MKPADGTAGGAGVVTGIRRRSQLALAAADAAAGFGPELLIEEQVAGANYRLLYMDGELLDAVVRRPPTVVGDGRTTIRGLVAAANAARLTTGAPASSSCSLSTWTCETRWPNRGCRCAACRRPAGPSCSRTVVNQNFGAENATATDRLCEAVVEAGARATRAAGARLAGVDLITPDPTVPLERAAGVILEVNVAPGFHYHYHKQDGDYPVAVRVLERLLGCGAGCGRLPAAAAGVPPRRVTAVPV